MDDPGPQTLDKHQSNDAENGLWELAKTMTMMALAVKLLEELEMHGVGTNEVENYAAKREVQR